MTVVNHWCVVDGQTSYKGIKLTKHKRPSRQTEGTSGEKLQTEFHDIIDKTVKYVDARFKNLSQKPLSCFKVFDPSLLPHDKEEFALYGLDDIKYLVNYFVNVLTDAEKNQHSQGEDGFQILASRTQRPNDENTLQ